MRAAVVAAVITSGTFASAVAHADGVGGAWVPNAAMHVARADAATTVLNDGRVLVTGGATFTNSNSQSYPDDAITNAADIYNPRTGQWTATAPMPTPRERHTATLLADGRVLVMGGLEYQNTQYVPTGYIYDPAVNTWTEAPRAWYGGAVVALPDGRVLVDDGDYVYAYSPTDGTTQNLQYNFASIGYYGLTATTLRDGTVLFTHADGGALRVDPVNWTATVIAAPSGQADSITERSATLLDDGTVLVAGGYDTATQAPVASATRFNPKKNYWDAVPDMPYARRGVSAVRMLDGKVLMAGGGDSRAFAGNETFFYQPQPNKWRAGVDLPDGERYRWAASSALLPDGSVLLAGGWSFVGYQASSLRFVIDNTTPTVAFADGSKTAALSGTPLHGTAGDPQSGVKSVVVYGTPHNGVAVSTEFVYWANVTCSWDYKTCTWSVDSRIPAGLWDLKAVVTDYAGNAAANSVTVLGGTTP